MQFSQFRQLFVYALVAASAILFAGNLHADDVEDPVEPPPMGISTAQMGSLTVESYDSGGLAIDSRETYESQLTAQMATSPYEPTTSGMLTVSNQPTYESTDPVESLENPSE